MINLYTTGKIHIRKCKEIKRKLQIIIRIFFLHPRGITLSKIAQLYSKSNVLDLDIIMINLYTKFYFIMYNLCEENERKLQNIGISPWDIILSKIAQSYPNRT